MGPLQPLDPGLQVLGFLHLALDFDGAEARVDQLISHGGPPRLQGLYVLAAEHPVREVGEKVLYAGQLPAATAPTAPAAPGGVAPALFGVGGIVRIAPLSTGGRFPLAPLPVRLYRLAAGH